MDLAAHRLSVAAIERAAQVIAPELRDTPQYVCEPLADLLGCRLVVKVETLGPLRSFKGRGADFYLHELADAGQVPPLVCASAGNFGQGMAYATRRHGRHLTVYAAQTADPLKIERMRALEAEVVLAGGDFDAAKTAARAHAAATGALFVEDSRQAPITEGAGTIGLELTRFPEPLDAVVVPLGNGALLNGIARWLRHASPATEVIGVVATGAPAMRDSWRAGRPVEGGDVTTFADGIGVRVPVPEALDDMRGLVDDVVAIDDDRTLAAMRLGLHHLGLMLEPSAGVGIAAIAADRGRFAGRTVATVLCGGNVTRDQARDWLGITG